MANSFIKPDKIVRQALGLLQREIILPNVVWRYGEADFAGAADDTVTLRVPAVLTARDRALRATSALVADDIAEQSVPVVLAKHPYHLGNITDAQLTLDIVDFGEQVQMPQMRAVAEKLEGYIATALSSATYTNVREFNTGDPYASLITARRLLNDANVPMGDRFFVMGSQIETELLSDDKVQQVQSFGSDSAFREASLGRLYGFTLVTSNAIDPNAAYAMHRTAVAFANVAPQVPAGATAGARAASDGLALTWIRDYDPTYTQDRSLVHSFAGATAVTDPETDKVVRAVKFTNTLSS